MRGPLTRQNLVVVLAELMEWVEIPDTTYLDALHTTPRAVARALLRLARSAS